MDVEASLKYQALLDAACIAGLQAANARRKEQYPLAAAFENKAAQCRDLARRIGPGTKLGG